MRMVRCGRYRALALAVAATVALVAPCSAATATPSVAVLETASLDIEGETLLLGDLMGARQQHKSRADPVGSPYFQIQAESILLELDYAGRVLRTPAGGQPIDEPRTTSTMLTNASVRGIEKRDEPRLVVFPARSGESAASVSTACLNLTPSALGQDEVAPMVKQSSERPLAFDLRNAVQVLPCQQAALEIRGTFTVGLWEWDAAASSDEGNRTIATGMRKLTPFPDVPELRAETYVSNDTEAFLHVRQGVLSLPLIPGDQTEVYIDAGLSATVAGTLAAEVVEGDLGPQLGHRSVDGSSVLLRGDLDLHAGTAEGQRLWVDVGGTIETARMDGETLDLVAVGPAPTGSRSPLLLLGAAIAVVGGGGMGAALAAHRCSSAGRRQRAMGCFARAQDLEIAGETPAALRWCQKAIRLDPCNIDQYAFRARCHLLLGDPDAAVRDHRRVHERLEETDDEARGWNAFEAARACARAGRPREATTWLRIAASIDPTYRVDATEDPDIAGIRGDRLRPASRRAQGSGRPSPGRRSGASG